MATGEANLRRKPVRELLAVLLLFAVYGCNGPEARPVAPPSVPGQEPAADPGPQSPSTAQPDGDSGVLSTVKDDLLLEIGRPKEATLGSPVVLQVALTNKSSRPVTFLADRTIPPYGRFLRLVLKDGNGVVPPLTQAGERYMNGMDCPGRTVWLQPGQTVRDSIVLTDIFRLETPGDFHLKAIRLVNEHVDSRTILVIQDCGFRINALKP